VSVFLRINDENIRHSDEKSGQNITKKGGDANGNSIHFTEEKTRF
jgi:hypothetical protein